MEHNVTNGLGLSRSSIDPDRIRLYAETVGISNVTSQAYTVMAEELTDVLKTIVMNAKKYCMHGRRSRMSLDDIRRSCKDVGIQPPLGYIDPIASNHRHVPNMAGEDFFVREDPEIDLQAFLAAPPPRLPQEMHLRAHWLVFEGQIQPVPENIVPVKDETDIMEDELFPDRPSTIQNRRDTAAQPIQDSAATAYRLASRSVVAKEHVTVRPIPPATLSVEKQTFVKSVIEACVGSNDQRRLNALHSLEYDTGLQEALPTITNIIKNGIRANVVHKCLSMLIYLVRMVRSLALNKSVNLDQVLHHLIPSLLTCMMGRQLCLRPESDNHWALRDFSGKTLCSIVKDHLKNSPVIQSRIVRSMKKIFEDPESTYAMVYGTVNALNEMVNDKERVDICSRFYELLESTTPSSTTHYQTELVKIEASKLYVVLMKMEFAMRRSSNCSTSSMQSLHEQKRFGGGKMGREGQGMGR